MQCSLHGDELVSETTNFTCRMDTKIKDQCEKMYAELGGGVNLSAAVNVFMRESLRVGGFPFDVRLKQPDKTSVAAMLEAEKAVTDPTHKRYDDVEQLLKELKE